MKGYIKGKTVILLEDLPNNLQEGDEVEILISTVEQAKTNQFKLEIIKANNQNKLDKPGLHLGAISTHEDFDEPEEFRDIFESTKSWCENIIDLLDWMYDGMKYFPKSIGTMVRWFGEVVGYFDDRTTNGTVEGINNKLKLIKRLGYGFRNFSNFRLRSLLTWHFSINSP